MNYPTIANLIIAVGFPVAQKLVELWSNNEPVTPENFAKLRALADDLAKERMLLALQKAGVDPDSEQGKVLLELAAG